MDLAFDLPNARQFNYHWENLEWIISSSFINLNY